MVCWAARAQVNVLTYHNDNARTGQNTQESALTTSNTNPARFGKLWCKPDSHVDGPIHGQPLVLSNASVAGGSHNVVYVGTENGSVYALDARGGTTYWQKSLIPAGSRPTAPGDFPRGGNVSAVGILSTPVIDASSGTLYVVAQSCDSYTGTSACESNGGHLALRLHALDVGTGAEKFAGPVAVSAQVAGSGNGSVGGKVSLHLAYQYQRTGLLLTNGHLIMALGAAGDDGLDADPWFGWLLSYNASTLVQEAAFASTPDSSGGGIWMSGAGPAADASGFIYLATGNGLYDGIRNFGDSILKMNPPPVSGAWTPADWFTPSNPTPQWDTLNDNDVGSGGVTLINSGSAQFLVQAGKSGTIYLVNTNNMGKYCGSFGCTDQVVQEVLGVSANLSCSNLGPNQPSPSCSCAAASNAGSSNLSGVWGAPAYWNGALYFGSSQPNCPNFPNQNDHMKAYSFNPNASQPMSIQPTSFSPELLTTNLGIRPWSTPVASASSNGLSNGIVWTVDQQDPQTQTHISILHVYDATNLGNELFHSNMLPGRDKLGSTPSHIVPTVANGVVYVGTNDCLAAYGEVTYMVPITHELLLGF
jgi:hypothetical protein